MGSALKHKVWPPLELPFPRFYFGPPSSGRLRLARLPARLQQALRRLRCRRLRPRHLVLPVPVLPESPAPPAPTATPSSASSQTDQSRPLNVKKVQLYKRRCNLLPALQDHRDAKHRHAGRSHLLDVLSERQVPSEQHVRPTENNRLRAHRDGEVPASLHTGQEAVAWILGKLARDNGSVPCGDGERELVAWSGPARQAVREGVRARGSHRGRQGQQEGRRHRPERSDLPVPAGPPRVRPQGPNGPCEQH